MKSYKKVLEYGIFPFLLLLLPLIKCNQGIDLSDTCYSLVGFRFFPGGARDWTVATWLAGVAGNLLTRLPGGDTLLGMRLYTGLFVSGMAILAYFFLKGKMPAFLAFWGEVLAICLCWIPTTSLYNYLTFFLFLGGSVALYRGLIWRRRRLLLLAGLLLGGSVLTRLPNITECLLILAVFYYGWLTQRSRKDIAGDVGCCVAGFLAAFLAGFGVICLQFGAGAYGQMLGSLMGYQATDVTYSPLSMVSSVVKDYSSTFFWVLCLLLVTVLGRLLYLVAPGRFNRLKSAGTILMMGAMLRIFWGRGMFDFGYSFYWSFFSWAMVLLYAAWGLNLWTLWDGKVFRRDKLLSFLVLLIVVITPIGSNNGAYPNFNNLFLVAPVTLWQGYRLFVRQKGRKETMPLRLLLGVAAFMVSLQSLGYGVRGVFRDSIEGQARDSRVENCKALAGMYTNRENAAAIQDVVDWYNSLKSEELEGKRLLTLGDVPGFSWVFGIPSALSHDWPDMNTYPAARMEEELAALEGEKDKLPLVILRYEEPDSLDSQEKEKWSLLYAFLEQREYTRVLDNGVYGVYAVENE